MINIFKQKFHDVNTQQEALPTIDFENAFQEATLEIAKSTNAEINEILYYTTLKNECFQLIGKLDNNVSDEYFIEKYPQFLEKYSKLEDMNLFEADQMVREKLGLYSDILKKRYLEISIKFAIRSKKYDTGIQQIFYEYERLTVDSDLNDLNDIFTSLEDTEVLSKFIKRYRSEKNINNS